MQKIKNLYLNIIELYLSILSLPMVYRPKNHLIVSIIIIMVTMSILFNSGLYLYFHRSLICLFVSASILNIFFLKFNFIIRCYSVFCKSLIYFYKNMNRSINGTVSPIVGKSGLNIIIFYYLYNLLCFILTILIVMRLAPQKIIYIYLIMY